MLDHSLKKLDAKPYGLGQLSLGILSSASLTSFTDVCYFKSSFSYKDKTKGMIASHSNLSRGTVDDIIFSKYSIAVSWISSGSFKRTTLFNFILYNKDLLCLVMRH